MTLTSQRLVWVKSSFSSERDEFLRVAKDFTPAKPVRDYRRRLAENVDVLERLYSEASPKPLNNEIWRRLENTDSWLTKTPSEVDKAITANEGSSGSRNVSDIIDEFNTGKVRAPIILVYNRQYTLVAGNTRLMVARVSNVIPKVVFIDTDW